MEDLLRKLHTAPTDLPDRIVKALRNHGGGYYNHMIWWPMMNSPERHAQHPEPRGRLAQAITDKFGSFENFKNAFSQAAKSHFGSGWAWLYLAPSETVRVDSVANQEVVGSGGSAGLLDLHIGSFANQDPPLLNRERVYPVLGIDVWEHAHYLKYENKRPDYVDAWWGVINWEHVEQLYDEALERDAEQNNDGR